MPEANPAHFPTSKCIRCRFQSRQLPEILDNPMYILSDDLENSNFDESSNLNQIPIHSSRLLNIRTPTLV